jgi:hypothetical protein
VSVRFRALLSQGVDPKQRIDYGALTRPSLAVGGRRASLRVRHLPRLVGGAPARTKHEFGQRVVKTPCGWPVRRSTPQLFSLRRSSLLIKPAIQVSSTSGRSDAGTLDQERHVRRLRSALCSAFPSPNAWAGLGARFQTGHHTGYLFVHCIDTRATRLGSISRFAEISRSSVANVELSAARPAHAL